MAENTKELNILVFSDDVTFREDVKAAVGLHPYAGSPEVRFVEAATGPGVINTFADNSFDLAIFDGETKKDGAMSVAHTIAETINPDEVPPVIFVVARQQDEWLARGAGAASVVLKPVNALKLQEEIAKLLK
ncbi:hypothetical protein BK816_04795 [Boudabousia tangfeifanii]|uniref:Response regulatory domain-containing protein n=1 Tax=Boudabousia tangfeifanii TaxID=1912795 RepID=A0A1D9MK14_9ACTO|nr:response regulator [Boudabousia tangfeifanii]AOZ72691.1 hypothetical protein BK816_04795 [Boudabousia tangfeifanii]